MRTTHRLLTTFTFDARFKMIINNPVENFSSPGWQVSGGSVAANSALDPHYCEL